MFHREYHKSDSSSSLSSVLLGGSELNVMNHQASTSLHSSLRIRNDCRHPHEANPGEAHSTIANPILSLFLTQRSFQHLNAFRMYDGPHTSSTIVNCQYVCQYLFTWIASLPSTSCRTHEQHDNHDTSILNTLTFENNTIPDSSTYDTSLETNSLQIPSRKH